MIGHEPDLVVSARRRVGGVPDALDAAIDVAEHATRNVSVRSAVMSDVVVAEEVSVHALDATNGIGLNRGSRDFAEDHAGDEVTGDEFDLSQPVANLISPANEPPARKDGLPHDRGTHPEHGCQKQQEEASLLPD